MKYVYGNLFEAKTSLAHCVSSDFHMGAGIAVQFKEKFGDPLLLGVSKVPVGHVVAMEHPQIKNAMIFHMVTKEKFWKKPTLQSVEVALTSTRDMALFYDISEISMPKIACGLDGLHWSKVSKLINDVFFESGIQITIYHQ